MIRVEQLRKQFGSVTAVNGVTFTAENGAITGLLGPNGAGKTTTLRMLYAVMRPDSGSIKVDDIDAIANPHDAQGRLGVLPDGFGLYPRLTAREHLEYFGELHGISGPALRQRTKELLDLLDMNAIADRRTAGFSHGERTKVGLARALVHRDDAGGRLDAYAAEGQPRLRRAGTALAATQDGADPLEQLQQPDRLGDVLVGVQAKAPHLVGFLTPRTDDDHRHAVPA